MNRNQIEIKIHELLQTHSQMELMQMREAFARIRAIHHQAGVKGATVETTYWRIVTVINGEKPPLNS